MKTRHSRSTPSACRLAFTLIEVMIATTITLVLMGLVVQIFAMVGNSVSETRSTIQMIDRLRSARQTLQSDLAGITCAGMTPPLDPKMGLGYLEIVEGPIGSRFFPSAAPMMVVTPAGTTVSLTSPKPSVVTPQGKVGDTTLGDLDDMIMFTTKTEGNPFTGRYFLANGVVTKSTTTTSDVAEVCYFMRGTTLYRRSLLVKPGANVLTGLGFYGQNDISVHQEGGPFDLSPNPISPGTPRAGRLVANSLGDLTKRQNRYGHQPFAFPYDARFWGPLGLPTLRECTYFQGALGSGTGTWPFPLFDPTNFPVWSSTLPGPTGTYVFPSPPNPPQQYTTVPSGLNTFPMIPQINLTLTAGGAFDAWPQAFPLSGAGMQTPYPWDQTTFPPQTAPINSLAPNVEPNGAIYGFAASNTPASMQPAGNLRFSEDVILTNVLSFDVKVWDAEAPIVAHPGLDGLPGVAGFDDDYNGTADDFSELGAAGSDDIVWQPGDVYPDLMLPANLRGFSSSDQGFGSYDYNNAGALTSPTAGSNNWANTQYLTVLQQAVNNSPPSNSLPLIIQRGAYVDLAYAQNPLVLGSPGIQNPFTPFCGPGDFRSLLWAGGWFPTSPPNGSFFVMPAVYDTGSTSYEEDGLDEDAVTAGFFPGASSFGADQGTNGADDNNCSGPDDFSGEPYVDINNNGLHDSADTFTNLNGNVFNGAPQYDPPETEMPPPYRTKLHGVQIRLRVCDPDSRQIREVTIVQEFENE